MDLTGDDLAGIADLFGGLTRGELDRALEELAYRRGEDVAEGLDETVSGALSAYRLVELDRDGERLLVAGPTAFPELPEGAEDLPHIMDVERREIDREAAGGAALDRLRADAASAVDAGDDDRIATLLDVSYDLEAWAPVDLGEVRDRLDDAVE
jgi:hypothetical protein